VKKFKQLFFSLGMALVFSACSLGPRKGGSIDYPNELEQVSLLMSQGQADMSLKQIQAYLDRSENLQWYGHAYYLQGRVYQGQKNWEKAVESYRKAIRQFNGFDSLVEAQSLYRLSQVYEQTKQRKELIASLLDLMKRQTFFDQQIGDVEIPARLSAAYASEAQIAKAQSFHNQASRSLQKLMRDHGSHLSDDDIAKSYYYLGAAIYPSDGEDFSSLVAKLNLGQRYLLAATEKESSMWSEKAEKALLLSYQKLWDLLHKHAENQDLAHDPQAQKKQMQVEQLVMASDFYDLVLRLQNERAPNTPSRSRTGAVLRRGYDWQLRLEKFAFQLSLGPEVIRNKKIKNRPLLNKIAPEEPAAFKEAIQVPVNRPDTKLPPKIVPGSPEDIGKDPNL